MIISFDRNLLAGHTSHSDGRGADIDRPDGMDAWVINYTVSGQGRINRDAAGFTAMPHDVLLFPPAVAHDYGSARSAGQWTHLWVYFQPRPAWSGLLAWPERGSGVLGLGLVDPARRREVRGLIELAIGYATGAERRREEWAMNALERVLLRLDDINPTTASGIDPRVRRAMAFLGEQHRRAIRMDEVAAVCACSVSRLAHLFSTQTGMAPMHWLEEHRIARAREMLRYGEQPVAVVGGAVGIPDPVYFARVFRRRSGCSPRQYRHRTVAG